MNSHHNKEWKVLCWNVRGLNSEVGHRAVRAKMEESPCSVICLQATKCGVFITELLEKFALNDLTILHIPLLWEPLEGFWSYGVPLLLWVLLLRLRVLVLS